MFNKPKPIVIKKHLCPECGKLVNSLYKGIQYFKKPNQWYHQYQCPECKATMMGNTPDTIWNK